MVHMTLIDVAKLSKFRWKICRRSEELNNIQTHSFGRGVALIATSFLMHAIAVSHILLCYTRIVGVVRDT